MSLGHAEHGYKEAEFSLSNFIQEAGETQLKAGAGSQETQVQFSAPTSGRLPQLLL